MEAPVTSLPETRPRPWVIYGLGSLFLVVNAWFGTYAYVVVQATLWGQTALQRGPLVQLFALGLLNLGLARLGRRFALRPGEMTTLYAMLCIGTCAAGYGFVQILVNHLAAPFYENYATSSSKFQDSIWPHVPAWLAPRDPAVLNPFFRGNRSLYEPIFLRGWAVPVLAWSAFLGAIFFTLLCAARLLRRSWIEEERLTFPLVLLPLELAQGRPAFWKSRSLWLGFVLAGALESVNFLGFLYPSVPMLPLKPGMGFNEIGALLTERPWNAVGRLALAFYPMIVGIGYLLALDVSFSCWFLYLLGKGAQVFCSAIGLTESGGSGPANRAPFLREQGIGAFAAVALFSLWSARHALSRAWDSPERRAFLGAGAGLLFQFVFLWTAGLSPTQAGIFVAIYTLIALTLARIVSECGAGWAWAPSWSPAMFTADAVGVNHLTGKQATMLIGYTGWMSDMRDNPMPHLTESMKLAPGVGTPPAALLRPLLFASVAGIFLAFWAHLDIYYTFGAATAKVRPALANGATGPARQAVSLMITPTLQDIPGLLAAGVGALLALSLSLLRQRFTGWPLHPLGYALAATNSMEYMWCPFLIAWAAKVATLRYGGIRAFRTALPFFLGMILGDNVLPIVWALFGMATGYQQYMSFPH